MIIIVTEEAAEVEVHEWEGVIPVHPAGAVDVVTIGNLFLQKNIKP